MKKKILKISIIIIGIISIINILTFSKYEKIIKDQEEIENLNIAFYKGKEKVEEMPSKENSEW